MKVNPVSSRLCYVGVLPEDSVVTTNPADASADVLPTDTAVDRLLAACPAPPPAQSIQLADGVGRTLAAPVHAGVDVPGHDNSAVDGYAVRVGDGRDLPVRQTLAAGARPQALAPASAARIF